MSQLRLAAARRSGGKVVVAVVLSIVSDVLLVVAGVAAIYSMMSGKPKRRRGIAQRIAVLATSGVLLSEAHTRSGWMHWMNLGIGVFCLSSVVLQVVWGRRKKSRGKTVEEPNSA